MAEFTVEDVVRVTGRGTVLVGRASGPVHREDMLRLGEVGVSVRGVERFLIPDPDWWTKPIGLLVNEPPSAFAAGETWEVVGG